MEYSVLDNLSDMSGLLDNSIVDMRCNMFLDGVSATSIVEQQLARSLDTISDWCAKVSRDIRWFLDRLEINPQLRIDAPCVGG